MCSDYEQNIYEKVEASSVGVSGPKKKNRTKSHISSICFTLITHYSSSGHIWINSLQNTYLNPIM